MAAGEDELRGRVKIVYGPVRDTELGSAPELLSVTFGAREAGTVLASSLISWIQTRRTTAKITVESVGYSVTLDIEAVGDAGPLLEQILQAGAEGRVAAATSRAVLIGVSHYTGFPVIPAARNSLQSMRDLLSDRGLGGWAPEQVTVIPDPASAASLAIQVADLAEATTGVFLLYYVGHGVLSARGELCLTVTSTRADRPKVSGLPWADVADVLRDCPARMRLVILDCSFAGRAIEAPAVEGGPGPAGISGVEGVYTLTATAGHRTAHVPSPDQQDLACTSFTGVLRDLIRVGIPGKPPCLTLSDIYPVLRAQLLAKGLPVPYQRGIACERRFGVRRKSAVRRPAHPITLRDGRGRAPEGYVAGTSPGPGAPPGTSSVTTAASRTSPGGSGLRASEPGRPGRGRCAVGRREPVVAGAVNEYQHAA
jgi:Effector Associated Constant Component 1/Caspase domain